MIQQGLATSRSFYEDCTDVRDSENCLMINKIRHDLGSKVNLSLLSEMKNSELKTLIEHKKKVEIDPYADLPM